MTKSTAQKTIESYIKHEQIIEKAVEIGQQNNLDVSPTEGNDPRGDIRVRKEHVTEFLNLLGDTIDKNQKNRGGT